MELDEGELFMELIRDVANELDIDVLCHKILVNVGLLTHADRGSLFLAKGPPNNKYLVAKLFDVTQKTGESKLQKLSTLLCITRPLKQYLCEPKNSSLHANEIQQQCIQNGIGLSPLYFSVFLLQCCK